MNCGQVLRGKAMNAIERIDVSDRRVEDLFGVNPQARWRTVHVADSPPDNSRSMPRPMDSVAIGMVAVRAWQHVHQLHSLSARPLIHAIKATSQTGGSPRAKVSSKCLAKLQMRNAIILTVILIAASTARPQGAGAIESESELAKYCQSLESGTKGTGPHIRIPNTKRALLCWGYIEAMQDLSVLVSPQGQRLLGSCPPEQTTLLQLIHLFVSYTRSHPKEVQGNAAAAVITALQEAFPCHQIRASAEQRAAAQRPRGRALVPQAKQ